MSDAKLISMEELLLNSPQIIVPEPGTLIEGRVIVVHKNRVLVDLGGVSTGVILGKEANDSHDTVKSLNPGDEVTSFVLEPENDEGLVVLSLRKASQKKTWQRYLDAHEKQEVISVTVSEANKGGLLIETDGIKGFVPVSQLAPMNYPRVNGADHAKILARLQKLVGEKLDVRIINIDHDSGKLILSEKAAYREMRAKSLSTVKVGDNVKGKISGVVNFGIFVTFNGLEGLVHISEIAWGHVKDPSDYGKLGDEVDVKVIGIDSEKISLSMKQLTEDPWLKVAAKYAEGSEINGEITRLEDFGAFVALEDDINGLIHVSDFTTDESESISKYVEIGDKVKAQVIVVDGKNRRIGLSVTELTKKDGTKTTKEAKKPTPKASEDASEASELDELNLGAKLTETLVKAGFTTKKALAKATDDELEALDSVGKAAVKKIREALG
ncbi:S1 RNA-binding domain-containing protein [Candidatus Gracilibacteria bacterium]|jgi:small subunit ribosomal protein S1|nr:S1 RNA-binding domain-containing protein [Candidatus Gracilibacteria bacterium]